MIRNLFIDLDDTLFDFHKSEALALSKSFCELGIVPTEENISLYSRINQGQWERLERREATREEILLKRFEILFSELGITNRKPCEAQTVYEKNLSNTYFYIDGAEEVLSRLSEKYNVYIASNGTAVVQDKRIALSGIKKYIKEIFISQKVGHDKPSKAFFDACFEKIKDFKKEETIMVGDSLTSDILGGINAGIKTCLFNPKRKAGRADIIPDYEIFELAELSKILCLQAVPYRL